MKLNFTLLSLLLIAVAAITGCDEAKLETNEDNSMDSISVTLEGTTHHGNEFPALKIHIHRNGIDEGSSFVRFPEMIEASDVATNTFMKFYQDNRDPAWPVSLKCEPLNLPIKWEGCEKSLSYTMNFDNGMVLKSSAIVEGTTVTMSHKLTNATDLDLKDVKMWNCIQNVFLEKINDPKMERTFTTVDGKYNLFKDMVPDSKNIQKPSSLDCSVFLHLRILIVKVSAIARILSLIQDSQMTLRREFISGKQIQKLIALLSLQ